jgi:hypothetical protein
MIGAGYQPVIRVRAVIGELRQSTGRKEDKGFSVRRQEADKI